LLGFVKTYYTADNTIS